jgi:hypothetical protein
MNRFVVVSDDYEVYLFEDRALAEDYALTRAESNPDKDYGVYELVAETKRQTEVLLLAPLGGE